LRNGGKTGFNALAQRVEPALHAADALKQSGIHQSGHRLAVFVDDDAVLPVLHLVEHFAQVLPKGDGAGLGDHVGLHLNHIDDYGCYAYWKQTSPVNNHTNQPNRMIRAEMDFMST
jgi:hypothetical protein